MLNTIFATKIGMSQAWSTAGKRLPITKLFVDDNCVLDVEQDQDKTYLAKMAYGKKKLKNVSKPLREQISKSGFSSGFKQIKGVRADESIKKGETINIDQVLEIGDVVAVQGVSKGHGFAGVVKRHGFHGGPRTHGQSDRQRAPGSIGSGTDPGRVWKGKKMPGHFGTETKTVLGLVVVHIDLANREIWVSGPVPGHRNSIVRIQKTGAKKDIKLNGAMFGKKDDEKSEIQNEKSAQDLEENTELQKESVKKEVAAPSKEIKEKETENKDPKQETKEEKTA
jgi:large subunit ribosomal protein L3